MARKQATTLNEIGKAAAAYITRHGYKQTQMADLAKEIGVSAGTLYAYVANKEALLNLATEFLIDPRQLSDVDLPIQARSRDELVKLFVKTAEKWARWPRLSHALTEVKTDHETLRAIGDEIYSLIRQHGPAILFLDRLANELPDIASVHLDQVRGGLLRDLATLLLNAGARQGPYATAIIARAAMEGISWSAMHRLREGLTHQPTGDLTEDDIRGLASETFAHALRAALIQNQDT
ncbi:MAG: helix-turn-helix domain-containing protein [Parvibaculum sp.]